MLKDISYKNYRRQDDIHGTVLYPAVMVAPVQKDILVDIAERDNIRSVFDPFHGSGTALYESGKVFPNARLIGCDINPFANLVTKTKLKGVSRRITYDIDKLCNMIQEDDSFEIFDFPNREKWFRDDIALSLTKIRNAIIHIKSPTNRLFFWCMLSDVIRRYSNSRSSTYKLHIKPADKICAMPNGVIIDFLKSIRNNYDKYTKLHCSNFALHKHDILLYLPEHLQDKVDVIITSPPYGDNNTTVPYGGFSSLALRWISPRDLELEGWELNNYSVIDSYSLGGSHAESTLTSLQNNLLKPYLKNISKTKQRKVLRFFNGYFKCLDMFAEIATKYIVLTLGNRTVDCVKINMADITKKYLQSKGLLEYQTASREIINKRTPRLTSKVNNKPVKSMSEEYILIYRRSN